MRGPSPADVLAVAQANALASETLAVVGFTGTRDGMTEAQREVLTDFFCRRRGWLHHGDCVGSDEEAHGIAKRFGWLIGLHPPYSSAKRAFCKGADRVYPPLVNLSRNKTIVEATAELVATPKGPEIVRSGTWMTIRYARKRHRLITIIHPDGSLEFNP